MFANMPTAIQHVRDGRLRALALNSPDLKDRLTSQGADPIHQSSTPLSCKAKAPSGHR